MKINSVEEAQKYLSTIEGHLAAMAKESMEAELYSHAGIWYACLSAFNCSTEEVDKLADFIRKYLGDAKPRLLRTSNPFDNFDELDVK